MATSLSSRDNLVLQSIFDRPPPAASSSPNAASLPHFAEDVFAAIRQREQSILRTLAEHPQDDVMAAEVVRELSNLIDEHPQYASAYANRAQATRLILPVEGMFSSDHASESSRIFNDLGRSIKLATPPNSSTNTSPHQSDVLATARTHRGFLLLKIADMVKTGKPVHGLDSMAPFSAIDIEEMASEDFARGGRCGNAIAQQMAVKTNPYAKMCGAIVRDALQKEIAEQQEILGVQSASDRFEELYDPTYPTPI
jgi:hypothetical protein